jgi:signal peptide peptidase SppA
MKASLNRTKKKAKKKILTKKEKTMKGLLNYARLANRVLNTALMIDPSKLQIIMLALSGRFGFTDDQVAVWDNEMVVLDRDERSEIKPRIIGRVAIVPVAGTLVHKSGFMDAASGLMSYQSIAGNIIAAMENPNVDAVLLEIDSYGGEVSGCFDLANFIYESRGEKPIWALSNEACYSAAYCIASACDKVFLTETAGVGSIGVYGQHVDFSQANADAGIVVTPIFAGARKNDGSPDFPLSEEAAAWMQDEINRKYDLFVQAVATTRGISEQSVRDTEAGLFFGPDAVKMNLADGVLTFDQTVLELQASIDDLSGPGGLIPKTEGSNMKLFAGKNSAEAKAEAKLGEEDVKDKELLEKEEDMLEEDNVTDDNEGDQPEESSDDAESDDDTAEQSEFVEAAEVAKLAIEANAASMIPELLKTPITMDALKEKLDTSGKIRDLCAKAGASDKADTYIQSGMSVADVSEELINLMATRTEASDVSSKPSGNDAAQELEEGLKDGASLVIADAKRRKAKFEANLEKARRN